MLQHLILYLFGIIKSQTYPCGETLDPWKRLWVIPRPKHNTPSRLCLRCQFLGFASVWSSFVEFWDDIMNKVAILWLCHWCNSQAGRHAVIVYSHAYWTSVSVPLSPWTVLWLLKIEVELEDIHSLTLTSVPFKCFVLHGFRV